MPVSARVRGQTGNWASETNVMTGDVSAGIGFAPDWRDSYFGRKAAANEQISAVQRRASGPQRRGAASRWLRAQPGSSLSRVRSARDRAGPRRALHSARSIPSPRKSLPILAARARFRPPTESERVAGPRRRVGVATHQRVGLNTQSCSRARDTIRSGYKAIKPARNPLRTRQRRRGA